MSGIFACVCCDFVVEDASDGGVVDDEGSMQAVSLNRHNYHIRCTVEHALMQAKNVRYSAHTYSPTGSKKYAD